MDECRVSVAEQRVAQIAARQKGLVTTAQLLEAGIGEATVRRWVAKGRLHRVFRAVYAVGHPSLMPFARELAAVLACGEWALISHGSAAALWRMTKLHSGPVDITIAWSGPRSQKGIRIHRPRGEV